MSYTHLFKPGRVGRLELRNRIISAPMEKNLSTADGEPTGAYAALIAERARGGAALIFPEAAYVHPAGRGRRFQLGVHDDRLVPPLQRLVEAAHGEGALIGMQLNFVGRQAQSTITGLQPWSASGQPCLIYDPQDQPRPLAADELPGIVELFVKAALRCSEAGFDVVELHGAHGYILGEFLSPFTNTRTDAYGGSAENRMRLALETVDAVRRALGPDFPLSFRLSSDEFYPGGLTIEDTSAFVPHLERHGVDLVNMAVGLYESRPKMVPMMDVPPGAYAPLAKRLKKAVSIPVSVVGRINHPDVAEAILADELADFVVIGRALHADHELPRKAREGRAHDIRPCITCSTCAELMNINIRAACVVNPRTTREREMVLRRAARPRRVVVVGGGVAGMQTAEWAAERGHRVTLVEATGSLGGQVRVVRRLPHFCDFGKITDYLAARLPRLGVDVRLRTVADLALLREFEPEAVVVATGAVPVRPAIPGLETADPMTVWEVVDRSAFPGITLVVGADIQACAVAAYIAAKGGRVEMADPGTTWGEGGGVRIRQRLIDDLASAPHIRMRLRTTVERIEGNTALLQHEGETEELAGIGGVVLAVGAAPDWALADRLASAWPELQLHLVGDAVSPRRILEAIREGAEAALRL